MLNGFEEAFMDAQASSVSLCMELLEDTNIDFDKVYIYMHTNEYSYFFNTFFEKDRKIYSLLDLFDVETAREFLYCGTEDVINIRRVCGEYEANCPYEMKLIYNVKSRSFDADYKYEDIREDDSPSVHFVNWEDDIKKSLN